MNKAFYILCLIFSVCFILFVCYYIDEVSRTRVKSFVITIGEDNGYDFPRMTESNHEQYTLQASWGSFCFILYFMTTDVLGLLKVKTTTTKVLSIIGISISGIFLFWDLAILASPSSISFDEVGPGFVMYGFMVVALAIVGLIQSVRFTDKKSGWGSRQDLLDS